MNELTRRTGLGGELLAEFLGTMILILFGDGVVAVVLLFQGFGAAQGSANSASWMLINWGWGFAVMLGVFVAGTISGAHLNPAVTVGLAVRKAFPWNKVGWYVLFQVLGAWFAALILFIEYNTGFTSFESKNNIVRGSLASAADNIFFTSPHTTLGGAVVPLWNATFDEVLGTFLLVFLIFAITDARNSPPLSNIAPLIIGLLVVAIGMSFGVDSGYAINPARDFGPRLLAWMAGWGQVALPGNGAGYSNYFWVPIVAPIVGAIIAAYVYDYTLHPILRDRFEKIPGADTRGEQVRDERSEVVRPATGTDRMS
ncbi:MAG TPA: MIP/aquaporin family protein [Ktedonobacterales bacterium]|jgi:glycerol uptake facilitator protein|nr:MIP/aquaporin family protein [Ktedonobacterales bacterium]